MDAQKTIVVGIDGSACAREALRFAVREARLRGDQLRVVWTWQMPISIYAAGGLMPVLDDGTAERLAHRELDEVLGDDPGVVVELLVEEGSAARVLIRESENAEVLVVGSRGHGGFVGLLLGSVGQQCAAHARCPVVIVHKAVAPPPEA
jgi:nucleotide-binding universal stress UspA family protein